MRKGKDMTTRFAFAALAGALLLGGCATPNAMESYVGKPITEAMLDYGRPSNVFDLDDNRRAFQWMADQSGSVTVSTEEKPSWLWSRITGSDKATHVPQVQSCAYTLTAVRNGDQWIVDSFRKPRAGCE